MKLSLETFLKLDTQDASEKVGPTSLSVDEGAYMELVEYEETLKVASSRETLIPIDDSTIDVDAPDHLGGLKEQKVRIFLDEEGREAHFHLVAKRASDEALVYTEPTMIKLIAI
jgi:hypothetical protein